MTVYRSLIGGYFSSPADKSVKASVWSNNPGAINGNASWVQAYPGFVKTVVIGGGNPIAVFETPEQGVALWHALMQRYRNNGAKTVGQIINRYGGGQNYSAYVAFVVKRTGLPENYEITLTGDDDNNLVKFAKAMFRYEAGIDTPLSDAQLNYGFELARKGGSGSAGPVIIVGGVGAVLLERANAHGFSISVLIAIAVAVVALTVVTFLTVRAYNKG